MGRVEGMAYQLKVLVVVVLFCTASAAAAAAVTDTSRFVSASGTTMYELGVSIGKQQKDSIAQMFQIRLDFFKASNNGAAKVAAWAKYANASLQTIATHAPATLEEMRGVADGAGLPLTTLLQLATDYESGLWLYSGLAAGNAHTSLQMPTKACTAFGWANSTSSKVFCGQNNDEKHSEFLNGTLDAVIARNAVPNPHGPALATITYSHPGMPAYMGTNGAGLSVMWTAIAGIANDAPAHPTETVPTVVLLREVLQFSTLRGAVNYLRNSPRGVPNNFILSQPGAGLVSIEMTTSHFTALSVAMGEVAHSNTLSLDQMMEDTDPNSKSGSDNSTGRLIAMLSYLREHRPAFETFDVRAAEDALSQGDDSKDGGILNDYTLASMVFGPECGNMRIRFFGDAPGAFRNYLIPCQANISKPSLGGFV